MGKLAFAFTKKGVIDMGGRVERFKVHRSKVQILALVVLSFGQSAAIQLTLNF